MSPLVSAPNRGYSDWQRISNYDEGLVFSQDNAIPGAGLLTPILDVSRYLAVGGWDNPRSGAIGVVWLWYADSAGITQVGQREWSLDPLMGEHPWYCVPNEGPFLQILYIGFVGGAQVSSRLFGTNRQQPSIMTPYKRMIFNQQNRALAAGGTDTIPGSGYYAGPALIWVDVSGTSAVQILSMNDSGTYDIIWQPNGVPANTNLLANVVIPPGAFKVLLANQSGVAITYYITLIPSATGSL